MLLISIHPFAFRRLVLIVLALAGFSALCFADPVLMTRRYSSEKVRTHSSDAAHPDVIKEFLADRLSPISAWNPAVTLEDAAPVSPEAFASVLMRGDWGNGGVAPPSDTGLLAMGRK